MFNFRAFCGGRVERRILLRASGVPGLYSARGIVGGGRGRMQRCSLGWAPRRATSAMSSALFCLGLSVLHHVIHCKLCAPRVEDQSMAAMCLRSPSAFPRTRYGHSIRPASFAHLSNILCPLATLPQVQSALSRTYHQHKFQEEESRP